MSPTAESRKNPPVLKVRGLLFRDAKQRMLDYPSGPPKLPMLRVPDHADGDTDAGPAPKRAEEDAAATTAGAAAADGAAEADGAAADGAAADGAAAGMCAAGTDAMPSRIAFSREVLALRQEVMWPERPPEYCSVEGDEDATTWHYGVRDRKRCTRHEETGDTAALAAAARVSSPESEWITAVTRLPCLAFVAIPGARGGCASRGGLMLGGPSWRRPGGQSTRRGAVPQVLRAREPAEARRRLRAAWARAAGAGGSGRAARVVQRARGAGGLLRAALRAASHRGLGV